MIPRAWCVVPAAGSGQRFGGPVAKQFVVVEGKSVLLHSLEALARHASVEGLVVALPPSADVELPTQVLGKPVLRCEGGASRADSVLAGLRRIPLDVGADILVMVHDAARPNVQLDDLTALLAAAGASPSGALLALPMNDTLKQSNDAAEVACTVPRGRYWRAMTPQCFAKDRLIQALEAARDAGIEVTDESMAMEHAGVHPKLVAGRADNLKITTQPDLDWFRIQVAMRASQS